MKLEVHNTCADYNGYRAARVKSLFNCESGANFTHTANLPIDEFDWHIGVIVGPSGSGKSSLGRQIAKEYAPTWRDDQPIIEAIAPDGDFNTVAGALSAVGLGDVPAWLRPYHALSTGEKFRANLARLVCDAPRLAVVDEFTSVVDRQIAKVGAGAFGKAWRRTGGRVVLLSCHYDILDWLNPDWVYDTASGQYERGRLRCRPPMEMLIHQTNWRYWREFEPHHYLKLPHMVAADCYVATINGDRVAHLAVSPRPGVIEMRSCRMVVLPEWQGAGVGMRFLNGVCQAILEGKNRFQKPMRTLFHTSHPGLCAALRRDSKWTQISGSLVGQDKARCIKTLTAAANKSQAWHRKDTNTGGFGGHFRAVQGFRYLGHVI